MLAKCRSCRARLGSIFKSLDDAGLDRLAHAVTPHRYTRGQVLHYEGTPCVCLHCLGSGKAKVVRSVRGGRSSVLRLIDPGELAGIRALFDGTDKHSSTVEMIEDGVACVLEREHVLDLATHDAAVSRNLIEYFARRLLVSERERVELAVGDVRERTARLLSLLAHRYGKPVTGGVGIDVCLSRDEMAQMIGAAEETIIRQIGEFRAEGIVENHRRQLVITDGDRLARIAHLNNDQAGND